MCWAAICDAYICDKIATRFAFEWIIIKFMYELSSSVWIKPK